MFLKVCNSLGVTEERVTVNDSNKSAIIVEKCYSFLAEALQKADLMIGDREVNNGCCDRALVDFRR